MFIYALKNTVNGKLYVGLTTLRVANRWAIHLNAASSGSSSAIHCAIRKYGAGVFVVEQIATLLPGMGIDDLRQLERDIIAQEGCMAPRGYNLTTGGEGMVGTEFSDIQRNKLSAAWTDDRKADLAKQNSLRCTGKPGPRRGAVVSSETRSRQSAAQKVRFERDGASVAHLTTEIRKSFWTEERRAAARERRVQMNRARTGEVHSPETRAKRGASIRAFHAAKRAKHEELH